MDAAGRSAANELESMRRDEDSADNPRRILRVPRTNAGLGRADVGARRQLTKRVAQEDPWRTALRKVRARPSRSGRPAAAHT